ncbi:Piso0_004940 [Millerozyma farinosa CBS 7064]|uniref:Piso0_004940 protein n=1 Tax=Pichia sorbitophila (strain ATCC MYA-4447 / BCRC 22081 / CBS 7064 / NBRC 10061 / NRRL Y-12695) TaxID=559304 RepID=G8Y3T2_PICSO|nr:Piso0_004940 [Millerozyma farinosa CBS 7064]
MTRISSKVIREANRVSKLLPPLLRATKNLDSAKCELQWIKRELPKNKWTEAVMRRSNYEPLQYVLGSQPFGPLDIICRRNVLIPRWETEEWVLRLSDMIRNYMEDTAHLKILDACTGTGCISLLLHQKVSEEANYGTNVLGFDVSSDAVTLANDNLDKNRSSWSLEKSPVTFRKSDIFHWSLQDTQESFDLIVSNPPYVTHEEYSSPMTLEGVARSVKLFEPSLALIGQFEFYEKLVDIAISTNAKAFIFELGSNDQVVYVERKINQLAAGWKSKIYFDTANKIRCVLGWKKDSVWDFLEKF